MTPQLALLVVYSAILVALGVWIGRRVRGSGDFFVARRRLGAGLIFATVLAPNIGAGSTVGATGLGYSDGLSAWWWNGSAGLGSLLLALWIGPKIWREAAKHDFLTVGDFLEDRYGRNVRGIVASLIWFGTLSILAAQLIGLAWILNVVIGVPKYAGCLIGGALITAYFTAGGLLGSAWVNLVQLVVKLVGFALALPLVIHAAGGLAVLQSVAGAPARYTTFWGGEASIARLALLVPAFMISPGLLQKAYGAKSPRALRFGIGLNGLALMAFALVPAGLGMAARSLHPGLANPELALPTLFMRDLPAWVGALGLAAIFSAEVSAADAVLFMLSTSLSRDLYQRFVNPRATDRQLLSIARLAALAGGTSGVLLAIASPGIISSLGIFYALLGVTLFVPVIAGLHTRKAGTPEAVASVAAGISADLAIRLGWGSGGLGVLTPELGGIVAAAIGFGLVVVARR
jgi:solute:Na+ symporter, SSS family